MIRCFSRLEIVHRKNLSLSLLFRLRYIWVVSKTRCISTAIFLTLFVAKVCTSTLTLTCHSTFFSHEKDIPVSLCVIHMRDVCSRQEKQLISLLMLISCHTKCLLLCQSCCCILSFRLREEDACDSTKSYSPSGSLSFFISSLRFWVPLIVCHKESVKSLRYFAATEPKERMEDGEVHQVCKKESM